MQAPSAILLPARLETRFYGPGEQIPNRPNDPTTGRRLQVLVIPDVCWYDRHDPAPTPDELDLLRLAVRAAGGPLLGTPDAPASPAAAAAFDRLAGQLGPGRAAWLARTFPPVQGPNGPEPPAHITTAPGPRRTRLFGLPEHITLYADDGTAGPVRLATSTVGALDLNPQADGTWITWDTLAAAGLTFTVDLTAQGIAPEAIRCLYVTGLGTTQAAELFERHLAAGQLGLAGTGTPVHTVAGAPAADLAADPQVWRALAEHPRSGEDVGLSLALTGDPNRLARVPGSDTPGTWPRDDLLTLLFPGLFGHTLHHLWEITGPDGRAAVHLGQWAEEWLRPQGPWPPVRIGAQPYGLWPVTTLTDWQSAPEPVPVEAALAAHLPPVRAAVADAAASPAGAPGAPAPPPTVVGADSEQLWDLLARTPVSTRYDVRLVFLLATLQPALSPAEFGQAVSWWKQCADQGVLPLLGAAPGAIPAETGDSVPLDLGPVLPGPHGSPRAEPRMTLTKAQEMLAEAPARWLAEMHRFLAAVFTLGEPAPVELRLLLDPEPPMDWWPSSLLFRLLVVTGLEATAGRTDPEPVTQPGDKALGVRALDAVGPTPASPGEEAYKRFSEALERLRQWTEDLANRDPAVQRTEIAALERALGALLDTAGHRIDPWITGLAQHRLADVPAGSPRPLGLYAWADRPFTGKPGPRPDIGFLLAPSDLQAHTAVLLRDQALRHPGPAWRFDVDSAKVRAAARLAEEIRIGAHPGEAVGRLVEQTLAARDVIDRVRAAFPLRTEHAGRRTCDGLAVLRAALGRDGSVAPGSGPADTPAAALTDPPVSLTPAQLAAVRDLGPVVDTYADLLLAEAVHDVVCGRPEAAGRTMDAAAGLATPPDLDVLRTRRPGRTVHTTVLAVLPDRSPPGGAPVAVASPALADWLDRAGGSAAGPDWTWSVATDHGDVKITLQDLELTPPDTLAFGPADLDRLAAEAASGPTPASLPSLVKRPAAADLVRRLAATLTARPPTAADLGLDDPALDTQVAAALATRLDVLGTLARRLSQDLQTRTPDSLTRARAFGIAPAADPLLTDPAQSLQDRQARAKKTLDGRLAALGPAAADRPAHHLAADLSRLAVGHDRLPVLAALDVGRLGPLVPDHGKLESQWLELTAAVRPALAGIEAHQARCDLDRVPRLAVASTHPGDPWLQQPLATRPAGGPAGGDPRLLVAFGPDQLPAAGPVAVGVLDTWAETVPVGWVPPGPDQPEPVQPAGAAFAFTAPAARPPQAVLLAVPATPGGTIDADQLPAIVAEARLTAHARMARSEDLQVLDLLLPSALLPAFEHGGFQFRPDADPEDW
ncbi:hypothetical protein [Kitasatospora aureofaciens]|uniref:hypothetical protein n=1 Tax=Kitasatospora aureofaciens TaxID=1894 RepID=UPI0037FB409B